MPCLEPKGAALSWKSVSRHNCWVCVFCGALHWCSILMILLVNIPVSMATLLCHVSLSWVLHREHQGLSKCLIYWWDLTELFVTGIQKSRMLGMPWMFSSLFIIFFERWNVQKDREGEETDMLQKTKSTPLCKLLPFFLFFILSAFTAYTNYPSSAINLKGLETQIGDGVCPRENILLLHHQCCGLIYKEKMFDI